MAPGEPAGDGSDGSTVGSMLLWISERVESADEFLFWVHVYRGMREIEGTWARPGWVTR